MSDNLHDLEGLDVQYVKDIKMSKYTNTRTGGVVPYMFYPKTIHELSKVIKTLVQMKIEYVVLGGMTNTVVSSSELSFVVINTSKLKKEPVFDEAKMILEVSAGYEMKHLSVWAKNNSVSGLQWMEGIPGTVGAGAFMNAGFLLGQDFEHFLVDAKVLMPDLTIKTFTNTMMNYSYRKSSIQNNGGIILTVRLLVRRGKKWKIALRCAQYHRRRAKHQPLEYPSAGTVFIPPTPYHVGGILPKLGLTGYSIGGAQISKKSPGFIVNTGGMTGEDYFKLVRFIQNKVLERYGIQLEPEVRLIGFKDED